MPGREVPITGAVLGWAREESGLSRQDLADSLGVRPEVVSAWEQEEERPTNGQLTRLAGVLHRPSAVFFLPEPPRRESLPTYFRQAPGLAGHELSDTEMRHIRWARRLQEIFSWVLRDRGAKPVSLPRFSVRERSEEAASTFRRLLGITPAAQLAWESPSEAFRGWRGALEEHGVLVLQLQMGKGNIRGFSAWDDVAPMAAVNTAYHPTARIFTLFHEVGHLVTRTDAACLRFIRPTESEAGAERWCERFAAEVLVPGEALRSVAASFGVSDRRPVQDVAVARRMAGRFKVSTRAVSLRLQEMRLAPQTLYGLVERELAKFDWNQSEGGSGGQPAPEKRLGQVGERIPEILFAAAEQGRVTEADLADYLRLTTGQLSDLRRLIGSYA